jgi:hypothetical protein
MQRRTLLKLGLGAAAILAVAGGGLALMRPGLIDGRMTPSARTVFHAVARAVLDGSLPADAAQRESALAAHMLRLDAELAGFPAALHTELSQLLALLVSAPGRLGLTGLRSDWPDASVAELQQALQGMRTSSLQLRQQVYHALRDLTNGAYYADPAIWPLMGYPGQRPV